MPYTDGILPDMSSVTFADDILPSVTFVKYIERDANGGKTELTVSSFTEITSGMTTLSSGFYVVGSDVTVKNRLTVANGATARIILKDGAVLNCAKGIGVTAGSKLYIYGQENDTGKLLSYGESRNAGIGGIKSRGNGYIAIHGGDIHAEGGKYAAGIGAAESDRVGNIEISGGKVNAYSGNAGVGIGSRKNIPASCEIKITGGEVETKTLQNYLAGIGAGGNFNGTITISGGKVRAVGNHKKYAAIGACDDFNGTVNISGGELYAQTAENGAVIGSGADHKFNGTVNITGGNTVLEFATAVHNGAPFIGSGKNGSYNGTINIDDKLSVYYNSANDDSVVPADERVKTCCYQTEHLTQSIRIKACEHGSVWYTINDKDTHNRICKYCGASEAEEHTFDNDGICVCGFNKNDPDTKYISVTYKFKNKTKTIKVKSGVNYTLPDLAEVFPDDVIGKNERYTLNYWYHSNNQSLQFPAGNESQDIYDTEFIADYTTEYAVYVRKDLDMSQGGDIWTDVNWARNGDTVTVYTEPYIGYYCSDVHYQNMEMSAGSYYTQGVTKVDENTYTFKMEKQPVRFFAVFKKNAEQEIRYADGTTHGTVTADK